MRCGHQEPSSEESSYLAKSPYEFREEYKVVLKNIQSAEIEIDGEKLSGSWTMVYDEGFDIEFSKYTFFAFSKYAIDSDFKGGKSFKSQCYSTCVGWYSNRENNKWGCYKAFKQGVDANKVTYYNTKNTLNIVEPTAQTEDNLHNNILDSMMNIQFRSIKDKITFPEEEEKLSIQMKKSTKLMKMSSSFLAEQEMSTALLRLDSTFKNHALYIHKLNGIKKNWSAGLHPDFSNMSIRELNKFAGIPRANRFRFKRQDLNESVEEDISGFSKNFDWREKLKPAASQGNCGSCYVYSTIRMLEARLKIAYNHEVDLSVQHALDCAFYNQGCNGGYPFLVMKFASQFELIPEQCKPYTVIIIYLK
jgi:cathepsin C